ncbi:hypothetical protein JHK84_040557 [Glycine max]|nr:hypothetical protein JHK84_040557 [Glycine max]
MAYHASSKANQNLIKIHEIHFGKSYSIENFHGGPKLQPYYQNEAEKGSNLDKLLMQFMETTKSTQRALQSVEIQVGELAEAKGRQGEHEETLSAILSLITNIFLEMIWNVLPDYMKLVWSEDLGSVNLRHELQMYSHLAALGSISLYLTLPSLTLSSTKCFGGCRFMLSVVCYIVVSQLLQHVAMLHDTIAIVPNVNFLVVLTYYD